MYLVAWVMVVGGGLVSVSDEGGCGPYLRGRTSWASTHGNSRLTAGIIKHLHGAQTCYKRQIQFVFPILLNTQISAIHSFSRLFAHFIFFEPLGNLIKYFRMKRSLAHHLPMPFQWYWGHRGPRRWCWTECRPPGWWGLPHWAPGQYCCR